MSSNTLYLMHALIQSLSHQLRTHLSVISNDLNYYKTAYPQEDFDRDIGRCRQIAEILRLISCLNGSKLIFQQVSLSECFGEAACELKDGNHKVVFLDSKEISIEADREKLVCALSLILRIHANQKDLWCSEDIMVSQQGNRILLEFELAQGSPLSGMQPAQGFAAVFNYNLGFDSVEPPLIDAIFFAHGWSINATSKEGRLTFEIMLGL